MIVANQGSNGPQRTLSLFDAICIIVGTIIGAGVFQTAPLVASFSSNAYMMVGLWCFGGLVTVIGALCFAELTTRFVDVAGGDYGFIKLAYGRPLGFLFAWSTFWIIRPGNIGAMAFTFATYFDKLLGYSDEAGQWRTAVYTLLAVVLLSCANLIGLRQGKWIQNGLTMAKVVGIGAIVLIGFFVSPATAQPTTNLPAQTESGAWLLALVFVMFSFGGWNDLSFVATEVQRPERNLLRSLLYGSLLVTLIYVLVNISFVWALGFEAVAQSNAVATDLVRNCLGEGSWVGHQGSQIIAGLICISCLGAINGIIITSPRIYYAAGQDFPLLSFLGNWNSRRNQPWIATVAQAIVTVGFCMLCFQYQNPFEVILVASAPLFWIFLGLAGFSLIVFRFREPTTTTANHYRAPFFPITPLILTLSCGAMAFSSLKHMLSQGYWLAIVAVFGVILVGFVMSFCVRFNASKFNSPDIN